MNQDKATARVRRARQTRIRLTALGATRLAVFRTNSHIYAQVISGDGSKVLVSASSAEADVRAKIKNGGNTAAAEAVGTRIAEKAKAAGVDVVAFDRSGYQYHGRVKALAEAARAGGLKF
jgi:large subunit ribosomal protein L18